MGRIIWVYRPFPMDMPFVITERGVRPECFSLQNPVEFVSIESLVEQL